MEKLAKALMVATLLACLVPTLVWAVVPYSQDFEGLVQTDPTALANDNWLVYGNVSLSDGSYLYGYGPYAAPNEGPAFSQIDMGQGGEEQGVQQLVVISDYNNGDHASGYLIESIVYQEQSITADNVGQRWLFEFQSKKGNLLAPTTAAAFIKTLDPNAGYATTNYIAQDMTAIPETWGGFTLSIDIDASLVGQLFQIGFSNVATGYQSSAIFYDNIVLRIGETSDVPDGLVTAGVDLRQNYPNPFNPATRIEFALERPGNIEISVYDVAGRLVKTLHQGPMSEGEHHVNWNGTTTSGSPAPAGYYSYVLRTAEGQTSRSMILVK